MARLLFLIRARWEKAAKLGNPVASAGCSNEDLGNMVGKWVDYQNHAGSGFTAYNVTQSSSR